MAETELAIVVRARDQLTATLRQMGTTVEELARKAAASFERAGRASEFIGAGVGKAVAPATELQRAASAAASEMQRLGAADTSRLEITIAATRAEVERLRSAAATELIPGDTIAKAEALEQALIPAEQALASLKKTGDQIDIAARIAQAQQAVASLGKNASLAPLEAEIARAKVQLEAMRTQATLAGGKIGELDKQKMDGLAAGIREGERALVRLRAGIDHSRTGATILGTTFTTVGATIKSALLPILPILTLAGAAFAAQKSVKEAIALEDALSKIHAEAGLTEAELENLRRGALETARALGLSESVAAPALLGAVTDGAKDAADGLDRFSSSARLAAALGADVGKSVDLQTSILNAYRDANLGAGRAADVTFGIVRGGKVEIEDLAGSLDAVLPLAAQLGVSFEELGAVIVTATQKGGGFAQGMQAVRAILGTLTDASPETKKALEGVDFSAARIRAEGLVPVLEDISRKLRGNAESIRAVFPDGRAFGAVLALLADQGKGLAASLDELANSSGAVEDALGRRLQSPMVQLGIIVNRLRSELGERLGGAFSEAVTRAVATLGGLEAAAKKVGDVGKLIGAGLGAGLGVLSEVVSDQIERIAIFVESIGGADAIVKVLEQSARAAASSLGVALVVTRTFFEASLDGLEKVRTSWEVLGATVRAVPGVDLALKGLGALVETPEEARKRFAALREELSGLQKQLAEANAVPVDLAADPRAIFRKWERLDELEGKIKSVSAELKKLESAGGADTLFDRADALFGTDKFGKLKEDVDGLLGIIDGRLAKPRTIEIDVQGDIEAKLSAAEGRAELFRRGLADLRRQAEAALGRGFTEDTLSTLLTELARRAVLARDGLNQSSRAAVDLRRELAQSLQVDLRAKQEDLKRLRQGLDDARSAAQLLGRAGYVLDESFQVDSIAALESEIAKLDSRIKVLRGESVVVSVRIDSDGNDILSRLRRLGEEIGSKIPATFAQLGAKAGEEFRDRVLAGVGTIDPFEETLRLFRGGIEPSLGRQVQLINEQVDRQRDATDELRRALEAGRLLGGISAERLKLLDEETDALARSANLVQRRAALETAGLRRQAIALGVNPELDEDELRVQIQEARERVERVQLALALGVDLDEEDLDEAIAKAEKAFSGRARRLELRQTRRAAIYFGIDVEDRSVEQLQEQIENARDRAQAFADGLGRAGIRNQAVALGISLELSEEEMRAEVEAIRLALKAATGLELPLNIKIDPKKTSDRLNRDIDSLRAKAQAYQLANPIKADLLVSGIQDGSRALADLITGAKSGKEALRDFFSSMAAQAAQAAVQLLIVKSLIQAFGGPTSGVGAFLAQTFGAAKGHGFGSDGEVMAFARGAGFEAGARTSLASAGGVASSHSSGALPRSVLAYALGGAAVERFAAGGSPWREQIVDRPTLERSERLAGSAIVPLSGGGVATTGGGRLPVERRGSQLVVMREAVAHALGGTPEALFARAYAAGGAPWALFGEAGREGVMKMHRGRDGRPGLLAADGAVLPLARVEGGRLGVEAHALGGTPGIRALQAQSAQAVYALGGLPDFSEIPLRGESGRPHRARAGSSAKTHSAVAAFALGGAPAVVDTIKAARRLVAPYALGGELERPETGGKGGHHVRDATKMVSLALGGATGATRALWTASQAFEDGGIPDTRRVVETWVAPFAAGGAPDLERTLRTRVAAYAFGGSPGDIDRTIRTSLAPFRTGGVPALERDLFTRARSFAAGGAPDLMRSLATHVEPFESGGVPSVDRMVRTIVDRYGLGGAPDLHRSLRTAVETYSAGGALDMQRWAKQIPAEAFAMGGRTDRRAPVAFPIGGQPASAIRASTPVQASASAPAVAVQSERGPMNVTISPTIELTVVALDPRTAADVFLAQKKVIVQALAEELARSPAVRAAIRGDRS